jgi:hypothetical protein
MSATYIGYNSTDLITETSYEQDKLGSVNYIEKIMIPSNISVVTPTLSSTKTINSKNLRAVSINVTSSGGAFTEITTVYQGDGGTSTLQQDGTNSTGEEPIATNRNFNVSMDGAPSIVDLAGGRATLGANGDVTGTGGVLFDSDGGFLYFRKNAKFNFFGISSYLQPNLVYKRSFSTSTTPSLTSVGSIVTPSADFPTITSGASWLCLGISYQKRGNVFDVTHEFRASDADGWNTYVYGSAVAAPSTS